MILPLIARHAEHAEREVGRYAAWEAALLRVGSDWKCGKPVRVAELLDYVEKVGLEQRSDALQDLISAHLRLSWQAGHGQELETYFTELSGEVDGQLTPSTVPPELVEDELIARHILPHGDLPSLEAYSQRFAGRADVMRLLEGRCLGGGRYVKLSRLGRGAMGEVWRTCDRRLRRLVAIKTPRAELSADPDVIRRFADEAVATAGLEHPGIAAVHEYSAEDGALPYCVLKLVTGKTLGERIRSFHQPPVLRTSSQQRNEWSHLLQAFANACEAVAFAHSRGVLHCDLKPANIVLGEYGEAVVLDWGLGRRGGLEPTAPEAVVLGTPEYMAPEQADGNLGPQSDVFGLGAILHEMLTGRPPHAWPDGCRPADWRAIVRQARCLHPRLLGRGVSRALAAVCRKALARDPADRYEGAAQLARDVRRHISGEPVGQRGQVLLRNVRRWLRLLRS